MLGYVMWHWYDKKWVSYCVYHMAEHEFCVRCHTNIFRIGQDGLCSACREGSEKNEV